MRCRLCSLPAVLLLVAVSAAADAPESKPSDKPNILFIAVDDLRPQLGCYGADWIKSPNIDRLAGKGMRFDRAYCQQAVCSPSRTSLLTGLRPDSTKVYDLETHFRDTVPDVVTLPQCFAQNGYVTTGMGKLYHGGLNDEQSWSLPYKTPDPLGESYADAETRADIARRRKRASEEGLRGKRLGRMVRGPATERADVANEAYRDGRIAELAVRTLAELKEGGKPFFLGVGFVKPHLPFNAPARYWDLYDRDSVPLAANPFTPRGAPAIALSDWGELRNYADMPKRGPLSEEDARRLVHGYAACTSYVDALIGRVIDALDDLGLAENTIVVLWGDHGWKLGEHAMWCKHTNYENDTRVTLIVHDPRAKAKGASTTALVEFVDVYPTLCELAGVELPEHLEGTSFAPLLNDPETPWKKAAFSQYPRGTVMGYSMRTDRHRYTLWVDRRNPQRVVARELYDHQTDPMENVNVSGDPDNTKLVARLEEQLRAGWEKSRPDEGE